MNSFRPILACVALVCAMLAATTDVAAQKAPAATITVDSAKARIAAINALVSKLDEQIAKPAPKGATATVTTEWENSAAWLTSVRDRYAAHALELQNAVAAGGDMVAKMAQMNMQFLALQNATQNESRKFRTLSNSSKARHENAMSAIRNVR
jgi:hypothetical protein